MKMETSAPPTEMPERGIGSPWNLGVTAALWMTALMFAHRLIFGIASVPGLITERVIPLVPGQASGDILGRVGQFAKLIPELSAIIAQLIVGGMIGAWYARAWGRADAPAWKRWAFGPLVALGLWLATLAALWPVLGENYHGRPLGAGRVLTVAAILVDYLLFGALLPVLFAIARRGETEDEAPASERRGFSRRRALSFIGGGALIAPPPSPSACSASRRSATTASVRSARSSRSPTTPPSTASQRTSPTRTLRTPTSGDWKSTARSRTR